MRMDCTRIVVGSFVAMLALFVVPVGEDDALMPSLLTLSDVMGTGHHAAVAAKVGPGKTVAVVGDGAVGLCGVIAARRLGAEQIIILGRHPGRIALAKEFGATDVVSERGEEAVERVREISDGFGVHSVLECVGLEQSMFTAIGIARPGGAVGRVGVPQDETIPGARPVFHNNLTLSGGPAPVRAYIEDLLPDVLEGIERDGEALLLGFEGLLAGGAAGSILSGGLGDLLKQFQEKGQGDAANSWVSNGPNKQIAPGDLEARLGCQVGGWMAIQGATIGVPHGASHGIGHALSAVTGMTHGITSCIMLPHVLRFN